MKTRIVSFAVIMGTALSAAGTPQAAHAVEPTPHSHAYKPAVPGGGPAPWKAEDGWQPDPPPGPNDAPVGYSLKALAYPLVALASGSGYITSSEADVDSAVDMAAFITYELQVEHGGELRLHLERARRTQVGGRGARRRRCGSRGEHCVDGCAGL